MDHRLLAAALTLATISSLTAVSPAETLESRLLREDPAALARTARERGDPTRGAVLFHQPHLMCAKCHANGAKESPLGPDLAKADKDVAAAYLIESILAPSKVIKKGYETVIVVTTKGTTHTGLLAEARPDALVLRDLARDGQPITIPKRDIDERTASPISAMPAGLVNQLADRYQFLDLASYVLEIADRGPARARSLRPDPALANPPLPAYEHDLDHAGLIAGLDAQAFRRGEAIYHRLCASCHGTHDQPGSMPTSLRFATGTFKNGSDPYALYQTLTRGYGMMAPQSNLVPQQKYDVIHYLREAYLKNAKSSQHVPIDAAYLAHLPKGRERGPKASAAEPWLNMDYGPTLAGTFEIGTDGSNFAHKGIAVRLDPGPGGIARGRAWMMFDHDTLRVAAVWTGQGFIDWNCIHFNGRHEVHPRVVGPVYFESVGPGWANPDDGSFDDPRLRGRDGKPYGPLPRRWAHYKGMYHAGDQAVLSYTVGDTEVLEMPGLVGAPTAPVFTRTFNIGPRSKDMVLQVLRHSKGESVLRTVRPDSESSDWVAVLERPNSPNPSVLLAGLTNSPREAVWIAADGYLRLRLPAGPNPLAFTIWIRRTNNTRGVARLAEMVAAQRPAVDLIPLTRGGPRRWPTVLTTQATLGRDDGPFAVDVLTHPEANPWHCQMRFTGLDFFADGRRAAVCTWDGDVWLVGGLERPAAGLTWHRIASGLFQPLGLKIVAGKVHVGCRDQIVILHDRNGDGETDFYECFNNDHQVTESFHEFAMGLQTDAAGNFYYSKAARHGKPALVPHHGTLLRVSSDGLRTDILATGFRAANGVCVNPDGTFFLTDQEGHWTPKNRLNWVVPGRFYGNFWGYHDITDRSDAAMEQPLCWITNRFDRSPAELVWVESKAWGPLNGALLNLSYGHGKIYVVPHERVGSQMQGGMCPLPLPTFPTGVMRGRFNPADGHLYACGMFAWAGNQQQPGGLYRVRATGKPAYLPIGLSARAGGIALTFSEQLDPRDIGEPRNFGIKVWSLKRSANYGSDHVDEHALPIHGAKLAADGKTLFLEIPELRPTPCFEIWYSVHGADGKEVDGIVHGTIHRLAE